MKRAAAVIIQNDKDEILLLKRGSGESDEVGLWENLGGRIEANESAEQAITREVQEELGAKVINLETLFINSSPDSSWEVTVFKGKLDAPPTIQEPNMCSDLKWVPISLLKDYQLASYTREDFIKLGWI